MRLEEVDTPGLLIDLDGFGAQFARMAEAVPPKWPSPAAPTCQDPQIADHRQQRSPLGAVGVCCQKVARPRSCQGGIKDVFVSNEIVGASKLRRLACA